MRQGNARQGDTIALGAHDNLIRSEKRLVALAGVSGLAVIETADAAPGGRPAEQRGGARRGRRAGQGRAPRDRHPRPRGAPLGAVHRAAREQRRRAGYKVKEVVVDGHGQLTFQYHPGRDETWVIVEGEALVERDGEALTLWRRARPSPCRAARGTG